MSSKPRLVVSNPRQPARGADQMSFSRPAGFAAVDGRGRAGRRVADRISPVPVRSRGRVVVSRAEAIDHWVTLITRHCGTRQACADLFGVRLQTACYWFDGVSAPSAAVMFQAVAMWGDEMAGGLVA